MQVWKKEHRGENKVRRSPRSNEAIRAKCQCLSKNGQHRELIGKDAYVIITAIHLAAVFSIDTVFLYVQEKPLKGKIAELCSGLDSMSHSKWQHPLSVHIGRLACDFFLSSLLSRPNRSATQRLFRIVLSISLAHHHVAYFQTGWKKTGCVRGGMMKKWI